MFKPKTELQVGDRVAIVRGISKGDCGTIIEIGRDNASEKIYAVRRSDGFYSIYERSSICFLSRTEPTLRDITENMRWYYSYDAGSCSTIAGYTTI